MTADKDISENPILKNEDRRPREVKLLFQHRTADPGSPVI